MTARLSPTEILELSAPEADALLSRLEARVPVQPALVDLAGPPVEEAIVFGDTHGDWRTTEAIVARFLEDPARRTLVGLGDYVDRAPDDCREGSVANALLLLQLVADYPDRVVLLQGNHETNRRIAVVPHDFPEEVDALWGPAIERYARLQGLLERGPLAATSGNGAYFAHAGFPRHALGKNWKSAFAEVSDADLMELVWTDCAESPIPREVTDPFTDRDLTTFFQRTGLRIFLRGHDPHLTGRPVLHDRVLTLHSSRIFERYGGVLMAWVPLDRELESIRDVRVEHVETEGRDYS
jgi:hypothetical protein